MRRVLKKSGHLGKANWDAVIRVYDEADNVIETYERLSFLTSADGLSNLARS